MANLNNTKDRNLEIKFDMTEKPHHQNPLLKVLTWIICLPIYIFKNATLKKVNMKGLKPPYVLLCNHNAFLDFKVLTRAIFPHSANYVVAIDGFIKREKIMKHVGCIAKRKFTNDLVLVRNLLYCLRKLKQIVVIYPEARYSLAGTNSMLPNSLGKLVKMMKAPVAVLICNGHHIDSQPWNIHHKNNTIFATMTKILTEDEVNNLPISEIKQKINEAFVYDDYKWQLENKIKIKYEKRAEGLHKILYKCPECNVEFEMDSKDDKLFCKHCGKTYHIDYYNTLHAIDGETRFTHIPDWFEWEREEVRKEILNGNYRIEDMVDVDSLPNSKGFINLGEGKLVHDKEGFTLDFTINGIKHQLVRDANSMFGCHIEYYYNNKGDCIDLSTTNDTYYIYFKNLQNVVTKIHFATEELYIIGNIEIVKRVHNR